MEYNKLLADMVPGDRVGGFYILILTWIYWA